MSLIVRGFRFFAGLILFAVCNRRLEFERLLKDKRIAIIGAADSVFEAKMGQHIDGFDLVIRINKAPYVVSGGKWKSFIGSKTDILFHSFFENESSGGGELNMDLYDGLGIKYVINPVSSFPGLRVTFNFYKKYLSTRTTYRIPLRTYRNIERNLNGFRPTIGYCALHAVMASEFKELYVTGFTFFKTAFATGYRDDMKEPEKVREFISKAGLHDPEREFQSFLTALKDNAHKNIELDSTLKSIVENHR